MLSTPQPKIVLRRPVQVTRPKNAITINPELVRKILSIKRTAVKAENVVEEDKPVINRVIKYVNGKPAPRVISSSFNQAPRRIIRVPKPQLILRDYQVDHVQWFVDKFQSELVLNEGSVMRSGKTFAAVKIAMELNLKIFVVCPTICFSVWQNMIDIYGANIVEIISYETLKGRNGAFNHNYLQLDNKGEYRASPTMKKMIREGILFVLDEVIKIKNEGTKNMQACFAITQAIVWANNDPHDVGKNETKSRVLNVSGCAGDDESNFNAMYKMSGIIKHNEIAKFDAEIQTFTIRDLGLHQLLEWCKARDSARTLEILFNANHITRMTYNLWLREGDNWPLHIHKVINLTKKSIPTLLRKLHEIVSVNLKRHMPVQIVPVINNVYYKIYNSKGVANTDNKDLMEESKKLLNQSITATSKKGGRVVKNINDAQKGLEIYSVSMLHNLYHAIVSELKSNPCRKVIVGLWYPSHIEWMKEALEQYGSLAIHGGVVGKAKRDAIFDKFQADNLKYRVFVASPLVCDSGVNLGNTTGKHPRTMFILPYYRFDKLVQFSYRPSLVTDETADKNNETRIYVVYSQDFPEQEKILQKLNDRSDIASVITGDNGIVLPCHYTEKSIDIIEYPAELPELPIMNKMVRKYMEN